MNQTMLLAYSIATLLDDDNLRRQLAQGAQQSDLTCGSALTFKQAIEAAILSVQTTELVEPVV